MERFQISLDTEAFGPSTSCGLGFNETSEMLEEEQRGGTRSMSRLRDQPKVSVRSWTRTLGGRLRDLLPLYHSDFVLLPASGGGGGGGVSLSFREA